MFQPTLSYGESLAQGGNDGYQDIRDPVVPRPVTTGYDTNAKEGSSIAYRYVVSLFMLRVYLPYDSSYSLSFLGF
jgi:hypothetical protein